MSIDEIAARWTGPNGGHRYWGDVSDAQIADVVALLDIVKTLSLNNRQQEEPGEMHRERLD